MSNTDRGISYDWFPVAVRRGIRGIRIEDQDVFFFIRGTLAKVSQRVLLHDIFLVSIKERLNVVNIVEYPAVDLNESMTKSTG